MRKGESIRPPAVAGMFYPGEARSLDAAVARYLREGHSAGPLPKAIIAPHAGYDYSGPIAGTAYARLAEGRHTIHKVVIAGPSHRAAFCGIALPPARQFATPLGLVEVDQDLAARVATLPQVLVLDAAHRLEHGIEVHLPFLQQALSSFTILPLVVGETTPTQVAEVLEIVWGGPETLIVISSDLSHYLDYQTAHRMDALTSRAIEALRPQDISPEQACGRLPIQGLLLCALKHGLAARTLDLRNSGDTAGPRDQVVGYGAYAFT